MTDATVRVLLLAVCIVLPLAALLVWSVRTAPDGDPALPALPVKALHAADSEEYPAIMEHDVHGEFPAIPDDSEAMAQLRAVMAGDLVRCAVCRGTSGHLFRVDLHHTAAFCCAPCATLLNAEGFA
jgi:hypothetical protein